MRRGLAILALGTSSLAAADLKPMRDLALRAGAQENAASAELLRLACQGAATAYPVLGGYAASRVHAAWLDLRRADYDPVVWARLDAGRRRTPEELKAAAAVRQRVSEAFKALFNRHHFIALPATAGPAVPSASALSPKS